MSISNVVNSISTAYMVGRAAWNVYKRLTVTPDHLTSKDVPYRPSTEWVGKGNADLAKDQAFMLTASNIASTDENGVIYGWFFDAFLKESHVGSVRVTEHPVQSGANISDHAYNLPDKLTIEILMSDVMDTVIANQFYNEGPKTKSISAYEVLRQLKEKRQPLKVRTRLYYYENMLIENMTTNDDFKTGESLRCTVMMRQIMMASVSTGVVSAKPFVSKRQKKGTQQTKTPGNTPGMVAGAAHAIQGQ